MMLQGKARTKTLPLLSMLLDPLFGGMRIQSDVLLNK